MNRCLEKFILLLWKNFLLQWRRKCQTVIELFAPVLLILLIAILRGLVNPVPHDDIIFPVFCPLVDKTYCPDTGGAKIPHRDEQWIIAFSPDSNNQLSRILTIVGMLGNFTIKGLKDEDDVDQHFLGEEGRNTLCAIEIDNSYAKKETVPENLEVFIRFPSELRLSHHIIENTWRTFFIYPFLKESGPRFFNLTTGGYPEYYREGWIKIQGAFTIAYMLANKFNNTTPAELPQQIISLQLPIMKLKRTAHASWIEDVYVRELSAIDLLEIIFMLSYVYPAINLARAVCSEKELQQKEAMRIMGLPSWLHWAAWFVKSFIFLAISSGIVVILLTSKLKGISKHIIINHTPASLLYLYMLCYSVSVICFAFLMSAFFNKANTASAVCGLVWFCSSFPYGFLKSDYETLKLSTKILTSLFINTAMGYGTMKLVAAEASAEGIKWKDAFIGTLDDNYSLSAIMLMLLIDSLIMLLLTLYLEQISPGEYGIPQPWYFLCQKEYWRSQKEDGSEATLLEISDYNYGEFFDKEPNLPVGIQLQDLYKMYNKRPAVRHLWLNIYKDQVTILLGHNGAGKTTTMSILTGMIQPTRGTAIVNGYDIRTQMSKIRQNVGLCPQHNILFDDLTVKEHLYFYSKLKGVQSNQINAEIQKYIDTLEFKDKADALSRTLSGGMKRKLNVGVALCGKSQIVILDEPSSGVDPSSRRVFWDLFQREKKNRTILLSTHFMDEADLLGDRIAIMSGGKLQCTGTSFFLKKKFGVGYRLIIEKTSTCDEAKITAMLKSALGDEVEIIKNVGSELTYVLPEDKVQEFEDVLNRLETKSDTLGIGGYGISLTTMDDVFLKAGSEVVTEDGSLASSVPADSSGRKCNYVGV